MPRAVTCPALPCTVLGIVLQRETDGANSSDGAKSSDGARGGERGAAVLLP